MIATQPLSIQLSCNRGKPNAKKVAYEKLFSNEFANVLVQLSKIFGQIFKNFFAFGQNFGLRSFKPSAAEAVSVGKKSWSTVDLLPSVDHCLLNIHRKPEED